MVKLPSIYVYSMSVSVLGLSISTASLVLPIFAIVMLLLVPNFIGGRGLPTKGKNSKYFSLEPFPKKLVIKSNLIKDIQHWVEKIFFLLLFATDIFISSRLQILIQIFIPFQKWNLILHRLGLRTSASDLTNTLSINRKLPPIFSRKTRP